MSARMRTLLSHLHRLAAPVADDATLLTRWIEQRDQHAFAAMMARHGPMVLGVCRRLLGDVQEAEDVFQAVFVVLSRQASRLRQPESLPGFLHTVAVRMARKSRRLRRRQRMQTNTDLPEPIDPRPNPLDMLSGRELLALLDEEIARLSERYRLPLVLCLLQGRTAEEAARQLGWSLGSLRGRLTRGRERLMRSDSDLSAGAVAFLAPVAVPEKLLAESLRHLSGPVPIAISALASGMLPTLKLKILGLALVLVTAVGLGAGFSLRSNPEPQTLAAPSPTAPLAKNDPTKVDRPRNATSPFPRRALVISVHDYLYANPLQNGPPTPPSAHNFNTFINSLNRGLNIPLNQIGHLSDDAAKKWGARAPTKTVIQKTVTNFLDSSRAKDRILLFFVGHSVELGDEVYLAPIEGELDKADGLIPLKWFYQQLSQCKARQKVLVLDVNRYNQTFGQERPGGGEMGPKMDAMLKAPPSGVQVWSSCVAKQRSYASDEYPIGVFLDSLLTALNKGLPDATQKMENPLPLAPYVARVNEIMKEDLSKRKLEQVSRLTGKEVDSGAAYDARQPHAPDAVTCLAPPPRGVEMNKMLVESVLDQIGTPPLKVTHEMTLRYDALPPFPVPALKKYDSGESKPDSPLRVAVKNARAVLWAIYPGQEPKNLSGEVSALRARIRAQLNVHKEGYPAPGGGNAENQFEVRVENDERKVALMLRAIEDALEELQAKAVTEARESESKRWKANYDFLLARMQLEYAYLFEYQSMLGSMRKEFPPRDPELHNGWRLASTPRLQGDSTGKKAYRAAHKLLDTIIKENAGSPWEVLAKREKLTNLGLEWQPAK